MKNKKMYLIQLLLIGVFCFIPSLMAGQTYKMYSTRNYHNQLRLNTMTGEVQQIQDDGQSWEICSAREISGNREGRFCLYETQNMWTFIMLDTYTGKNWQVQFSVKGEDYMFMILNMILYAQHGEGRGGYRVKQSKWNW